MNFLAKLLKPLFKMLVVYGGDLVVSVLAGAIVETGRQAWEYLVGQKRAVKDPERFMSAVKTKDPNEIEYFKGLPLCVSIKEEKEDENDNKTEE